MTIRFVVLLPAVDDDDNNDGDDDGYFILYYYYLNYEKRLFAQSLFYNTFDWLAICVEQS